jgi:hypothetical protein
MKTLFSRLPPLPDFEPTHPGILRCNITITVIQIRQRKIASNVTISGIEIGIVVPNSVSNV